MERSQIQPFAPGGTAHQNVFPPQPGFLTTPEYSLGVPEGRGFSPAEIGSPTLCPSRAPRSLRSQAARGAGLGNIQDCPATAGLKPRPSNRVMRNPA